MINNNNSNNNHRSTAITVISTYFSEGILFLFFLNLRSRTCTTRPQIDGRSMKQTRRTHRWHYPRWGWKATGKYCEDNFSFFLSFSVMLLPLLSSFFSLSLHIHFAFFLSPSSLSPPPLSKKSQSIYVYGGLDILTASSTFNFLDLGRRFWAVGLQQVVEPQPACGYFIF